MFEFSANTRYHYSMLNKRSGTSLSLSELILSGELNFNTSPAALSYILIVNKIVLLNLFPLIWQEIDVRYYWKVGDNVF